MSDVGCLLVTRRVLLALLVLGCGTRDREQTRRPDAAHAHAAAALYARRAASTPTSEASSTELRGDFDDRVSALWDALDIEPAPVVEDAQFVRRVHLDLVGRIPTEEEARALLGGGPVDREALVAGLLGSPDFSRAWADLYFDMLVPASVRGRREYNEVPRAWLEQAFATNMRYDTFVRALLTAEGPLDENGAGIFLVANRRGRSLEMLTASVADLVLGLPEFECAQCHDHPYDERFKQQDFYGLAAYLQRVRVRKVEDGETPMVALQEAERGELKVKLHGRAAREKISPSFLGRESDGKPHRREALADAVLASDLVTRAAVARIWEHLLGGRLEQQTEPWLDFLARDFADHDYDVRRLLRTIVLSAPYQRRTHGRGRGVDVGAERVFAQRRPRTTDPRRLFNSIAVATSLEPDDLAFLRNDQFDRQLERFRRMHAASNPAGSNEGGLAEVLFLLNGRVTNRASLALPGSRLRYILDRHVSTEARLEALFLTLYGRFPTPDEVERLRVAVSADKEDDTRPWEDLMFALLISTEFRSIP